MTDKQELIGLLTKWGVKYSVEKNHPDNIMVYGGYEGFFTEFEFDANGAFIKMGAWE